MTGPDTPTRSWAAILEDAERGILTEVTARSLSAVCFAAMDFCPESISDDRRGGFPRGRPAKEVVRAAATILLLESNAATLTPVRRVVALTSLFSSPQENPKGDLSIASEVERSLSASRKAADFAADTGDRAVEVVALLELVYAMRRVQDAAGAIFRTVEVLSVLAAARGDSNFGESLHADAPFLPINLHQQLEFRTHLVVYRANMDLGRLEPALAATELARSVASLYKDADPSHFSWAVSLPGVIYRSKGDVKQFLAVEAQVAQLVKEFPKSAVVQRRWTITATSNASRLRDYARAQQLRFDRLQSRVASDLGGGMCSVQPTIEELMHVVARYRERGARASLIWLGNITYDIAADYVASGKAESDDDLANHTELLLTVAEAAWQGFALNGLYSVILSKARLHLARGRPCTDRIVDDLLLVNTRAKRAGTKISALQVAVKAAFPGDARVRARLDELLVGCEPESEAVRHARLSGLSAAWWGRRADLTGDLTDLEESARVSMYAVSVLRPSGVSIDLELEASAWMFAAEAIADVSGSENLRLDRLVKAVQCVAELMITISTTENRVRIADRYGPLFQKSLDVAASVKDFGAADLVMESARRDRVGLLLAELARDPGVSLHIRALAVTLKDSTEANPQSSPKEGSSEDTEQHTRDSTPKGIGLRSSEIVADRQAALQTAESVLGPLGALCDPRCLASATPVAILTSRRQTSAYAAVLQLLPMHLSCDGVTRKVFRRLTIREHSGRVIEYFDSVDVPAWSISMSPDARTVNAHRRHYVDHLLPPPLRTLLMASQDAVRLLIVPTGFFHVAFESLPITQEIDLIDRATVSIHSSLTGIRSLMERGRSPSTSPSVAIYDTRDGVLEHTGVELRTLEKHLDGVVSVDSLADLRRELELPGEPAHAILAMAVHGAPDDAGWGQSKSLPDGSIVTAAQMLGWTVPRLCVFGSCNTPIIAADGVELGGFPLALMLSGATTVVGGLYNIDDLGTSEIMMIFWELLGAGRSPVAALRESKLRWIGVDASRRDRPKLWSGLVTYGDAAD